MGCRSSVQKWVLETSKTYPLHCPETLGFVPLPAPKAPYLVTGEHCLQACTPLHQLLANLEQKVEVSESNSKLFTWYPGTDFIPYLCRQSILRATSYLCQRYSNSLIHPVPQHEHDCCQVGLGLLTPSIKPAQNQASRSWQ